MQTYKKRFRKKRSTKKRQSQKNRILKGLICYKIRVIPRSNGGGLFDGAKFERLENMIKDDELYKSGDPFLKEIIDGKEPKNIAKKNKVFNEIFNEDVFDPSDNQRDTEAEKQQKQQIRENSEKVKHLLNYLNTGKVDRIPEDKEVLQSILKRKVTADDVLSKILESLDKEEVKKQLTPAQIESIKGKIEGTTSSGITGALTSVTSKMSSKLSNGAVSLGNWLTPEVLDDDGTPIKLENRQKIQFLWYPRKHIDYKKGKSGTKHDETHVEYGDFMVLIEPEQYANTGEFFKQTYHTVEDLLATLLMGCSGPFCLKGEVKRQPYNWREFEITNKQPTIEKEK